MRTQDVELGFLAHPDGNGGSASVPGVVMVHDVWGLSDHTRDMAQRLAAEGFGVLAIDLYRRESGVAIEDPGRTIRELSDPRVVGDVQAGIDFLSYHEATRGARAGVTGFCMGGMFTLLAACACRGLSAAVPFYGMLSYEHGMLRADPPDPARKPRQPLDAVSDLRCPLLAFFGEEDTFIPMDDVRELERRLKAVDQPSEVVVYPGAGHAFMNDTRPAAHRPDAARDAWTRAVRFLREHLR